ncbi:MAG: S-layer homology domain-containing protein [Firmicutes bacterium]|nr:S-layer homology domain-containing protein [Bacillota bacterium]
MTELGQIGGDVGFTNTLACDPNGTFYCAKLGTYEVYAFTLDSVNAPEYLCTADTGAYVTHSLQTMEFDATRQLLCWVARSVYMYNGQPYGSDQYGYYEMNVQDKQVVRTYLAVNYGSPVYGLICPVWEGMDVSWAAPTYEVEGVYFEKDEYEVFAGYTANLRTYVMPWTLADQSLEYSSKDPSIAKVDEQGVVTGVREGETTIVAKSSLNGEKYGECTVVVRSLDVTLEGVLMDDQGATMRFSWDMSGGNSTWHAGAAMDYYAKAVTEIPGEDAFYLLDSRNNIMRKLDLHNGKPVSEETMEYGRYTLWDLAYSNYFSQEGAPKTYAVRESTLLQPQDPMHPTYNSMSPRGAKPFVGVAVGGTERVTYEDYYAGTVETDSEVVYLFDNTCNIWRLNVWDAGDGQYVAYDYLYSVTPTDLHVTFSAGSYAGYSSLVVGSDGALYLSAFTGKYSELYRLVYDELTATYVSTALGTFGRDIWPASLLHVSSNAAAPEAAPVATMRFDSAQQEHLEDAVEESAPTGGLNAILMPDESGAADSQVTFDPEACTVTVPVLASDSTNGLFCVNYDETLLELEDVRYGDMLHSQAAGDGSLTVGYADAAARNGVVAELTFRYVPAKVRQTTSLTLEVRQDGATLPETNETLELTIPALPIAFEDVKPGAWYYDAVEEMAQTGRMIGVSETRFAPQMNLTRGQLATILYRMEGSPDVTGMEHPFKDVAENQYYSDAVTWASAHGIVRGVTKTKFLPNAAVTREQMAVLLYRYADYKGYDMAVEGDLSRFPDGEKTSEYAEAAMCWAVSVGLFQGIAGGDAIWLKPQNGATRAQAATVLVRFLEKFPA